MLLLSAERTPPLEEVIISMNSTVKVRDGVVDSTWNWDGLVCC